MIDEASIQEPFLEGDKRKQQASTHKQLEPHKWKQKKKNKKRWNEKNIVAIAQEETSSTQQCKGCDQKGHTKENCWKLHLEKCPKDFHKKNKKKALISVDVEERVDNTSDPDVNINCTNLQKELALVSCSHKEEKAMTNLFCIKIHMKQNNVDCLFDSSSQPNLILCANG
jgi:hypothetical protein